MTRVVRLSTGCHAAHSCYVRFLLALPVVAVPVVLAVGSLAGRFRVRPCCAVDPARDLRMRAEDRPPRD